MKHFPNLIAVFGITLSLCFLSSIKVIGGNSLSSIPKNQEAKYHYTDFGRPVNVYDEHDNLAGFLVHATTDICGQGCIVEVLFCKINANNEIIVSNVSSILGTDDIFEKNKSVYRCTAIGATGTLAVRLGCHYFNVEKIKYVNGQFEIKDAFRTKQQYAFAELEAQGMCKLYPGLDEILRENGY